MRMRRWMRRGISDSCGWLMVDFLIRPYSPADSIPAITALLHEAYGSLARQGLRFLATHQDDAMTLLCLTSGDAFIAESPGEIIGTISVYPPWPDSPCELYRQPGVFRLGQLAVAPRLQSHGIGRALMEFAEQHACKRGAIELAMDTAEGATHLLDWYQRLGYRSVGYVQWDVTNYRSVLLSKRLA